MDRETPTSMSAAGGGAQGVAKLDTSDHACRLCRAEAWLESTTASVGTERSFPDLQLFPILL